MSETPICRHCLNRKVARFGLSRQLCYRCYNTPATRALYPVRPRGGYRGWEEPTQEELDALIAEQMQNLPEWWHRSQPHRGEIDRALAQFAKSVQSGRVSAGGRKGRRRTAMLK